MCGHVGAISFSFRRFGWALVAFLVLLGIGTIGYRAILDEGWVTALYRTIVTTTLTGEVAKPSGTGGEVFTIVVLLGGVAIFLYLAGAIAELIARGILGDTFAERRRRRTIEQLTDHVIICGFGRVGRRVAEEIRASGRPFVVLDVNEEPVRLARESGALVVTGDGTDDGDLEAAGLARASALVATADSDQVNLYITLSARALRSDLFIAARASDESAARKLQRAGANRVVQPYSTAGLHIANAVLKPEVSDFLDIVTTSGGPMPDLRIEEIAVTTSCEACGKTIGELQIQDATGGALVIALRKSGGRFEVTPGPSAVIEEGDVVIGVGTVEEIALLEQLFTPKEKTVV
jgi:voltage-gated potassium channel